MTTGRGIAGQSFFLMLGNWGSFAISFIVPIILVRLISVEEYGIYSKLVFVYTTGLLILELGVHQSVLYFYNFVKNKRDLVAVVNLYYLLLSVIIIALLILFKASIVAYFDVSAVNTAYPAIIIYFIFFLSSFSFEYFLIVEKKSVLVGGLIIGRELLRAIVLIAAAHYFGTIESIIWALAIFAIGYFSLWIIYLLKNNLLALQLPVKKLRLDVLSYSFPLGIASALNITGTITNKFFVGLLLSNSLFSIFTIGTLRINVVNMVFKSISSTLIPRMVELKKEQNTEGIKLLWHEAVRYAGLVSIPAFYFFFSIAGELIKFLFTSQYVDSIPVFRISIATYLVSFSFCGVVPRVFKKTQQLLYSNVITILLSIPLSFLLTKYYSVNGAVVSGIITLCIIVIIQLYINQKVLTLKLSTLLPWMYLFKIHLFSIIPALSAWQMVRITNNTLINLSLALLVFAIIFIGSLRIYKLPEVVKLESKIREHIGV